MRRVRRFLQVEKASLNQRKGCALCKCSTPRKEVVSSMRREVRVCRNSVESREVEK